MVGRRGHLFWVVLLLVTLCISIGATGKVTLEKDGSAQAEWWYAGEHSICDSAGFGPPYCIAPYGNHWSAEIGTHAPGDWAYVDLDCGRRMPIDDVGALGFRYKEISTPTSASAPSMAIALVNPANGDEILAISEHDTPVSAVCSDVDATTLLWLWGTWDGTDPSTFIPDAVFGAGPPYPTITFAQLQTVDLPGYEVKSVMVLWNVVGQGIGTPAGGTGTIAIGTAVVDRVRVEWQVGVDLYGGYYNLEPEWPFDASGVMGVYDFDDWTQAPLPGPTDPPRQFDHWCKDSDYCPHCQPHDDQNLWDIVHESDLDGLSVPTPALSFPSPEHAIYFGNKTTGNYDQGERAVGCICSPYNELNPADRYVTIDFDYFREVEQYVGEYDWTYVQIQFVDENGIPAWPEHTASTTGILPPPIGWYDPFDYSTLAVVPAPPGNAVTATTHMTNGDVEPDPTLYNRGDTQRIDETLYDMTCFTVGDLGRQLIPAAPNTKGTGWKTVWYKDSSDPNPTDWEHVEISHYLNTNNEPQTDDFYRIKIPPQATRMRIRFCFNSQDGASNSYFGWIIDNVEKDHGYDPPGCTICFDNLPQGEVGEKYGLVHPDGTYFELCPLGDGQRVRWELVSVLKDDVRLSGLPNRLALDPIGKIYGIPDPGTTGTYEVTLRLICDTGRPVEQTFILNIRPSQTNPPTSQIGIEHFGGPPPAGGTLTWDNPADPLPTLPGAGVMGCPQENLWHQTPLVKYALDTAALQNEYGPVAYFGMDDAGIPTATRDPNYDCERVKGCMVSPWPGYPINQTKWDGQELIIGFKSWRNVEYYAGGNYDKTWVDVKINNGPWQTVWQKSSSDPSAAEWLWEEAHTGIILEIGDKVFVQFCFDSVDGYNNGQDGNAWGWLVDEVTLFAGSADLSIVNCPKPQTSVNEYYNEEIRATGGPSANLEWEQPTGLPPGLGLHVDPANDQIAYIRGFPRDAGTYTFTLVVKVRGGQEIATRECTIEVGREVTLLWEDFEDDPTWSGTGLWRFTGTDDPGLGQDPVTQVAGINDEITDGILGDANHAAYYGRQTVADYNTGARTSGMMTLVTPVIDLANGPTGGPVEAVRVTFEQWREVEPFPGAAFDQAIVQVQFDGGAWTTIWQKDSSDASMKEWTIEQITPFLTDGASTMLIRFVFDSVDKWYNDYVGWLVDNVRIESTSASGANPLSAMSIREREASSRGGAADLQVINVPNPVKDVHTTTFMVRSVDVEAMRIVIYDISGAPLFEQEVPGNELVWHTENDYGEYLANGIYIYRAYVLVDGEWIETKAQKLVILR